MQRKRERIRLSGDVPDPSNPPLGCRFHPRCQYATDICRTEEPMTEQTFDAESITTCHRRNELELKAN